MERTTFRLSYTAGFDIDILHDAVDKTISQIEELEEMEWIEDSFEQEDIDEMMQQGNIFGMKWW